MTDIERIKRLEEEICYLHRDFSIVLKYVESINPEIHYHLYYDMRTNKDEQIDLNDFI